MKLADFQQYLLQKDKISVPQTQAELNLGYKETRALFAKAQEDGLIEPLDELYYTSCLDEPLFIDLSQIDWNNLDDVRKLIESFERTDNGNVSAFYKAALLYAIDKGAARILDIRRVFNSGLLDAKKMVDWAREEGYVGVAPDYVTKITRKQFVDIFIKPLAVNTTTEVDEGEIQDEHEEKEHLDVQQWNEVFDEFDDDDYYYEDEDDEIDEDEIRRIIEEASERARQRDEEQLAKESAAQSDSDNEQTDTTEESTDVVEEQDVDDGDDVSEETVDEETVDEQDQEDDDDDDDDDEEEAPFRRLIPYGEEGHFHTPCDSSDLQALWLGLKLGRISAEIVKEYLFFDDDLTESAFNWMSLNGYLSDDGGAVIITKEDFVKLFHHVPPLFAAIPDMPGTSEWVMEEIYQELLDDGWAEETPTCKAYKGLSLAKFNYSILYDLYDKYGDFDKVINYAIRFFPELTRLEMVDKLHELQDMLSLTEYDDDAFFGYAARRVDELTNEQFDDLKKHILGS